MLHVKRFVCCLLSCLFLFPMLAIGSLAAGSGDVNGDGRVDSGDIALIMEHTYANDEHMQEYDFAPLTAEQAEAADVNGDGVVTYEDADLLQNQLTGLIEGSSITLPDSFPQNALTASDETMLGIRISPWIVDQNGAIAQVGDFLEVEIYINSKKTDVNGAFLLQYDPTQLAYLDSISSKVCDVGCAGLVEEGYFAAGIATLDWNNGEEIDSAGAYVPIACVSFQVLKEGALDLALSVLEEDYSLSSGQTVEMPEPVAAQIDTSNLDAWAFDISAGDDAPQEFTMQGDMNADGSITTSDARIALRGAVGLEEMGTALRERADLDGDGNLTTADARLILRIAVGLDGE